MIDEEIKNLIYQLEEILKTDKRFFKNKDYKYKNHIKKIYQESKYNKKPIDLTNLVYLNNRVDTGEIAYINHLNQMLLRAHQTIQNILNN